MNLMVLCMVSHLCSIIFPLHICFDLFSAVLKKVQQGVGPKELWKKAITKAAAANENGKRMCQDAKWEPDLCIQMLKIPAAHNYASIRKMVEKAPRKWILQFLESDGLGVLLESLEKLGTRGFSSLADTFSQLQCVGCLRAVMNSECGLEFIIKRRDYTRQLANVHFVQVGWGSNNYFVIRRLVYDRATMLMESKSFFPVTMLPNPRSCLKYTKTRFHLYQQILIPRICNVLQSRDKVVKMQVFELLCALTMYSAKGHNLALDALNHFKMCHGRRYRFDLIIEELRSADTPAYKITLMAFINCLIFGYNDLRQRTRLRNELFGVGLGPILDDLRLFDDKELHIQMVAFQNQQIADEEKLEPLSHQSLFDIVFNKIANTPQALYFHSFLLNLSQIDNNNNPEIDKMWEILEEITSNAIKPKKITNNNNNNNNNISYSRKFNKRNVGTQTVTCGRKWSIVTRKIIKNDTIDAQKTQDNNSNIYSTVETQSDFHCTCYVKNNSSVGIQVDTICDKCNNCNRSTTPYNYELPINLDGSSTGSSGSYITTSVSSTSTAVSSFSSCTSLPLSDSTSVSSHQLENASSYDISSSLSESDVSMKVTQNTNNIPVPPPLPNNLDVSLVSAQLLLVENFNPSSCLSPSSQRRNTNVNKVKEELSSNVIISSPPLTDVVISSSKIPKPPPLPTLDSFTNNERNNPSSISIVSPPPPPPVPSSPSSSAPITSKTKDNIANSVSSTAPLPPPLPSQLGLTTTAIELFNKAEIISNSNPPPPPPPPSLPFTPQPPPLDSINENCATGTKFQNIRLSYECSPGHMTLPNKRNPFLNPDYTDNKYHTLPHPNMKMKTLNWTKVPSKSVSKSLWSNVDLPALPVDYRKMEELFCQKPKEKGSCSTMLKLTRSSKSVVSTVNLLDNKRSLAVNIFLKQFKTGSDSVINAINTGTGLSVEKLKALSRLIPEKGELASIKDHKDEDGTLGTAEKFFLQLSQIKNYELRVEAMLQKEECPTAINEICPLLDKILEACNFLKEGKSLKEFMKIVLHLGNYLNAGSYAGNAVGFKLNTLPKLLETRANKPRMTFLHFVVEVAQNHDSNMLNFRKESQQLRELSRTPLSSVEEEVQALSKSIKDLKKKLKAAGNQDVFNQFKDFISFAETNITRIGSKIVQVKEASVQLAVHFCEDPSTFQLDECFSLFADFFEKLGNVILENEQRRKQEESLKHSHDKKLKTIVKRRKSRVNDESDCVIDLLMKEIRGGTFKLRKTAKNDKNFIH